VTQDETGSFGMATGASGMPESELDTRTHGGHIRRWARDAGGYGVAAVAVQAIGVLSIPIFSRAFTTSQFGIMDMVAIVASLVTVLALLGVPYGLQREYYAAASNRTERRLVSTSLLAVTTTSLLVAVGIGLSAEVLSEALFESPAGTGALIWAAVAIPFGTIWVTLSLVLQSEHRLLTYGVAAVGGAAANLVASLILVFGFDSGLPGFFAGTAIGSAVTTAVALAGLRGSLGRPGRPRTLKPVLSFGLPIVPAAVMTWGLSYANRFIVLALGSTSMLGVVGIASRVSLVLGLAAGAFANAWNPQILRLHEEDPQAEAEFRARATAMYAYFVAMAACALMVVTPELVAVAAPPAYAAAAAVAPLLVCGVFIAGLAGLMGSGISLGRRTAGYSWGALIAVTTNLGLTALLLPSLGMVAVGVGTTAGAAGMLLFQAWRGQRLVPAKWEYRRVWVSVVSLAATASLFTAIYQASLFARLASGVTAIVVMSAFAGGVVQDWRAVLSPGRSLAQRLMKG
jgi:O-antigen/teichoic acid export membrane protein